jgi:hypothetical protein
MIPTEDNYTEWILFGIKEYFRRIDYRVRTYSIGQVKERQCPVDRILAVGNKIVGLQFKRPATPKPPWRYDLTPHQHARISESRWIFYCLPDFADLRFQEVSLYHCRFQPGHAEGSERYPSKEQSRYYRWGAFADALLSCWEGLEIGDERQIEQLIRDMFNYPEDTYLSLNKRAEEAYIVRDIPSPVEMDYEPA